MVNGHNFNGNRNEIYKTIFTLNKFYIKGNM